MPKSKRNKQIELAKTKKRGFEWKRGLFEEVRKCVDKYANVFVFSVSDMRNSKMKNVREQWKDSRFFIGKNKIMAMALGRFSEEEYKPNLHKLGQQIKGQRGLLFSNRSVEDVLSWFQSYSEGDFARSGNIATETVNLPAGPLTMFPHNQEPYLRQLGLPTSLVKGVIHLIKDYEVCKVGDVLTPESARILKLLQYEMAEFHITINCVWSQDGSFMQLTENIDSAAKENIKEKETSLISKSNIPDLEEMDVEFDKSDDSENENSNSIDIKSTSIYKEKGNTLKDKREKVLENCNEIINDDSEEASSISHDNSFSVSKDKSSDIVECDIDDASGLNCKELVDINGDELPDILECEVDDTSCVNHKKSTDVKDASHAKNASPDIVECEVGNISCVSHKETADVKNASPDIVECEVDETSYATNKKLVNENESISSVIECDAIPVFSENESIDTNASTSSTRKSRLSKRKSVKDKQKKVSLPKTPDANTSQESPLFRQLRNRSVKVSTKKK